MDQKNMTRRIIKTHDGSESLFVEELNEHYHSIHGARNESLHVFIQNGLISTLKYKNSIRILELGFGTGLNALLSLLEIQNQDSRIHYTGIEKYPLEEELWSKLNYAQNETESLLFKKLHQCNWDNTTEIAPNFELLKLKADIDSYSFEQNNFDIVYFDAFAPTKQSELWSDSIFSKMFSYMKPGAILVTYCAKGEVRRTMIRCGFQVERLPGPPGKREMLRALKPLDH